MIDISWMTGLSVAGWLLATALFGRAVSGDVLTATAQPLHVGRRTHVWEVRMYRDERLMANFVCTQMVLGDSG